MPILANKVILIVSPEPWDHIFVSKHHYAIHLSGRGNQVFFLNPPSDEYRIDKTEYDRLYSVNYCGFDKGLKYYPKFVRKSRVRRVIRKIEDLANSKFDIIWNFDSSVFYDLDAFEAGAIKIFHMVDLNQNFNVKRAASTADICFYSSRFIGKRMIDFNRNSFFVNHGVMEFNSKCTFHFKKGFQVKVGYAGNLDIPYIAWDLIIEVIQNNPDIGFYFAGSLGLNPLKELFSRYENMIYVGKLDSQELKTFYNTIDVLIIAYNADEYPEQLANPHKVMEYIATGKPIIATYTVEYEGKEDLLYMTRHNKGWPSLFKRILSKIDQVSEDKLVNMRKAYAENNTYVKQLDRIEKLVAESWQCERRE